MFAATHDISKLMRIVFVSKLTRLDRIVIEEVNKLCKQLYLYKLILFISSRVIFIYHCVLIVVHADNRLQHFVDLVRVFFTLKKRKKHTLENFGLNYTFFILDELI